MGSEANYLARHFKLFSQKPEESIKGAHSTNDNEANAHKSNVSDGWKKSEKRRGKRK